MIKMDDNQLRHLTCISGCKFGHMVQNYSKLDDAGKQYVVDELKKGKCETCNEYLKRFFGV